MRFSDLLGRRVVVWGYGVEGRAAVERLGAEGVPVTIALPDDVAGDSPGELADDPRGGPARAAYAADAVAALRSAEVVVKSPGVPVTSPLYAELATAGVRFTNMTDLWLGDNAAHAVGITGTKGKSTTASAVAHVLAAASVPTDLRGNIGAGLRDDAEPGHTVVIEVSSYQAQAVTTSPRVGVVTSLFPEHLPWHGGVEEYFADKLNLVAHGCEHVVLPGDDVDVVARVRAVVGPDTEVHVTGPGAVHVDTEGALVWPGVGRVARTDLPLLGGHNAHNLALAVLAAHVAHPDVDPAALVGAVGSFRPLAHRLEPLPSPDRRLWVDDNLATAPEAVVAALRTWPDEPVALIFGGADRGLDQSALVAYLTERAAQVHLLLIGPAGRRLADDHGAAVTAAGHDLRWFADLPAVVDFAASPANDAAVVLMSPGAPSFDAYRDYAARAAHLRALVAALPPS